MILSSGIVRAHPLQSRPPHAADQGLRTIFSLKENEYLFNSEGLDLLGICRFFEWIRGIPRPVIRDLSVGQLHRALVSASNVHLLEAELESHLSGLMAKMHITPTL